jgi:hypothetical protein
MSEIKLIGLVTGEQLIVKVEDATGIIWKVKNPAVLIPMGEGKLGFAPWLPYANEEGIHIKTDKIVFETYPQTDLYNKYNSAFGGLVVPDQKLATPKLTLVE